METTNVLMIEKVNGMEFKLSFRAVSAFFQSCIYVLSGGYSAV